jgi:hypothetical protein
MQWLDSGGIGSTVGAMGRGGRKEAPRWGVGALYSCQRRWTEAGAATKSGVGKQRRGSHGRGKEAATAI